MDRLAKQSSVSQEEIERLFKLGVVPYAIAASLGRSNEVWPKG
jgi:hypothetical protein